MDTNSKSGRVPVAEAHSADPDAPLVIDVGRQSDGGVYELHWRSRERVSKRFPDARLVGFVHVGYCKAPGFDYRDHHDFEDSHHQVWPHVASVLTGLSPDQLAEFGGVVVYDPVAGIKWDVPLPIGQK